MKNSLRHLEFLDCTRGVAILAVLIFHTLGMAFGYDALPWKGWFRDFSGQDSFLYFLPIGMISQAGVAIFFVVSGFCIHLSFQQQGRQWRGFFVRRFFRIYPAYFAALLFSLLILVANPGLDFVQWEFWKQFLSHLFLIHNFHPSTIYSINAALWSLAVEAQLYLLYPVLLLLVSRLGWGQVMAFLAFLEFSVRGSDGLFQMSAPDAPGSQVAWLLANSPLGCWFSWTVGAWLADAWLQRRPLPLAGTPSTLWLVLALAVHFVRPLAAFQFPLFALATAAFTANHLNGKESNSRSAGRTRAVLKKIGLWSYSLYLLHQPLLHVFSHVIVWAVPAPARPAPIGFLLVMVTWLIVLLLAVLWFQVIEIPAIAWGKRLLQAGTPVSARRLTPVGLACRVVALALCVAACLWTSDHFSLRTAIKNAHRAWVLATSPDPAQRNGSLAVDLAEDACVFTHYSQPDMVGVLSAAYAETGRFDEAIGAAEMACNLASQAGDTNQLLKNKDLLRAFLQHRPFREPSSIPSSP